jgi:hypothetical protein
MSANMSINGNVTFKSGFLKVGERLYKKVVFIKNWLCSLRK